MAFIFPDNWSEQASVDDFRTKGIRRNAITGGTNYINVAAFDFFDDAAAADEWIAFGYSRKFWGIKLEVGTAFVADSVTFIWEYSKTGAWATLNVTNANAMESVGTQNVTFTPPSDWKPYASNQSGYVIRCRIATLTNISEGGANATNKVQFSFRTLRETGTETNLSGAVTADLAGTYTILPATTSAVGIPTLEMPVKELKEVSFVDVILSGTTAGAGDTVDINGEDTEGNALTETIDVSGGDGTYTSTKEYRNITSVDCNGFADGTIQVDQKRWGIIKGTYISDGFLYYPYILRVHLEIGDGSTPSTLTVDRHEIQFLHGYNWWVNKGTFQAGEDVGSGAYAGSKKGCRILEAPHSMGYLNNERYKAWDGSIISLKGSYLLGGGANWGNNFRFSKGTTILQDTVIETPGGGDVFFGGVETITRVKFPGTKIQINPTSNDQVYSNIITDQQVYFHQRIVGTLMQDSYFPSIFVYYCKHDLTFLNCTGLSSSAISSGYYTIPGTIDIKFSFDLKVVDSTETGIDGVTVTIDDATGAEVFSGSTDANGDITQQNLIKEHGVNDGSSFAWTDTAQHTVTLSKTGYATRTVKYTMDRKREEIEKIDKIPVTQGIYTKGSIKKTFTKTVNIKARIGIIPIQTINTKANIKSLSRHSLIIKGDIKKTQTRSLEIKSRINISRQKIITAKAWIIYGISQSIESKSNIFGTTVKIVEVKANIQKAGDEKISRIKVVEIVDIDDIMRTRDVPRTRAVVKQILEPSKIIRKKWIIVKAKIRR